ncbi:MAG: Coq4 family protein [Halieaceae bacterium]
MRRIKALLARQRVEPLRAWRAMRELLKNPDDTTQVFHIIEALKGDSLGAAVRRLRATESGRALLAEKPNIVAALNDRSWLQGLPEGSVGRVYYDFVHAENLSADGLIASSETQSRAEIYRGLSEDEIWLADRLRDIHDLQHVMTGYGRDPVGELSLLSFMTTQTPNRGIRFIVRIGQWKYQRDLPAIDIRSLIREGADIARGAIWMAEIHWEEKLTQPLDAVRAELGFKPPLQYQRLRESAPQLLVAA